MSEPHDETAAACWDFLHDTEQSKLPTSLILTAGPGAAASLEMCTEILGCETGCHVYPLLLLDDNYIKSRENCRKLTKHFPPPLTSGGVRVQAHRGGGRLLITAFAARVYVKSERENGRLRLFLHMDYSRRSSEQENGGRVIGCSLKCGDGCGNSLTSSLSLPVCVAFS